MASDRTSIKASRKSWAIYTVVTGDYDRPISPRGELAKNFDFILFTDRPKYVRGWNTRSFDSAGFSSRRVASRFGKMFFYQQLSEYDIVIYIDANVALIKGIETLTYQFLYSNCAIGLFPHPNRHSSAEEALYCLENGKLNDEERTQAELMRQSKLGFSDDIGLYEGCVIFRKPNSKEVEKLMEAWFKEFNYWQSRDQISLPFAIWKTNTNIFIFEKAARDYREYFGFTEHTGQGCGKFFIGNVQSFIFKSPTWSKIARSAWRAVRFLK